MGRSRLRPRHRLREPERPVEGLDDEEVLGLLRACGNARDRFIVLALWRMGLRRGELTGLRGEDVHFVPDATRLGCGVKGPHLHVRRRENLNGAAAKSRRPRAVPADWLVVQAYDQYMSDRDACPAARSCDFLLVNLYRGQVGAPMRPGRAQRPAGGAVAPGGAGPAGPPAPGPARVRDQRGRLGRDPG